MKYSESKRRQQGLAQLQALNPEAVANLEKALEGVAPELVDFTVDFAYGDVFADPRLDPLSRQVATMAALIALGNAAPQLEFHVNASLNLGMEPEQIVEVLYVTTVFAGFPAGLNAAAVLGKVFGARGIKVAPAPEPETPRRERAEAALAATSSASGQAVVDGLRDVAPALGEFVLDFAYGDVISRQAIPPAWKEIAMVAAAAARGTMAPQMAVHVKAALNVGVTKDELAEVVKQMAVYAGFPAALNAAAVLRQVIAVD